jgi:hypothetical protein
MKPKSRKQNRYASRSIKLQEEERHLALCKYGDDETTDSHRWDDAP